ncbi:hypothetical protein ACXR0O_07855 [Verrucomicrobiota bacterium sgz303538]
MNHRYTQICVWLCLIACFTTLSLFAAAPEQQAIDPSEPRAQIRVEILKRTQLGSSTEDVMKFIRQNFQPKKDAPMPTVVHHPATGPSAADSDKKGVQSIRLVLGHYFKSPALLLLPIPLVAETTTAVQWAFDRDGKLIEVFVDKDTELGDTKGPDE